MVFFLILGVFLNLFTIIFYVNYAYFYVLFFKTALKYHSNKFLELKPKDEVTLPSPGVLFWLILDSKLQFFPFISFLWVPIFDPNTRFRRVFFHPFNIVELSKKKKCVQEANFGKVAKIKGSIFFK